METRRLGRTAHHSSVAILGGFAFYQATPQESEIILHQALAAGVNHVDVAPSYGMAEARLGPLLPPIRDRLFLGCKTMERTRDGARAELERSLELLQTDYFDLYQMHAVTSELEMQSALAPGGAAEALIEARDEGLVEFIGITGHFEQAPRIFHEVLQKVDLDTVMFMVNPALWALPNYREDAERLLDLCVERDIGVMAIKVVAHGPWQPGKRRRQTWYEPLESPADIQAAVNFALSLPIHAFATPGAPQLLPAVLAAAEQYQRLEPRQLEESINTTSMRPLLAQHGS